jgi:hypothetical protein
MARAGTNRAARGNAFTADQLRSLNVWFWERRLAGLGRLPSLASVAEGRSDRQTFASKQTIFEDEKR